MEAEPSGMQQGSGFQGILELDDPSDVGGERGGGVEDVIQF
jgi:hypothetical protein